MLKRIFLIIKRALLYGKELPKDIREFGVGAAIWIFLIAVLPSVKGPRYIRFLTKYMNDFFSPITEQFKSGDYDADLHIPENHRKVGNSPVWVCWLQGEENMPELVKVCYEQLKKNVPSYAEIHLITLDNYAEYITLPEYVMRKFAEGKITMIHFTDFLRSSLLYAYGGMWIDSTVWTANKIPDDFFKRDFYAQRTRDESQYPNEPSRARWSGFLLGGKKGNILFCYMRNALWYYWKVHEKNIEYIILDYTILGAYNNLPSCKRDIDAVPCNNEYLWRLIVLLNDAYDEDTYNSLINDTTFFKLAYKMRLDKYTPSGEKTYYKHIIDTSKIRS